MTLEFRVLGALEVRRGADLVEVGHARQRSVLAVLLVDVNQVVGVEQLLSRVWGDAPPRQARAALYSYLSRLRTALGGVPIRRRSGGYVLETDPATIDLHRFHSLVALGRPAEALALVRGEPFEGLHGEWFANLRKTLTGEITAAELDHTDSRLAAGEHRSLIAEMTARTTEHPLDERLAGQLMRALIGAGRRSDALAHYARLRHRLADELGLDPGPALRDLAASLHRPQWSPRRIPLDPAGFAGAPAALVPDSPIVTITGPPGAGKTRLALHWAHEHAGDHPDGRLFVDLTGADPADVVREFLLVLGTSQDGIPPEPHAQTALYRTLLADRRMLIVLDNAADTAQVVPLLPGTPLCRVVVTSRERLPGLVTAYGAQPVVLG
ncbi:DNA-binding transcriptional activator of the SARP family [Lentzea xinjiangensis]|uniref:DNA-binding transcriptional activator of the SARP family n=1 Tax=Lentzea xinjiangensis TaxID=402600 RepID=A0A1H9GQN1_9PSEU|nr:BTAD domain-containing putative transcriptional regulator [Lentzea xinjiangensis]SEQ52289.1 DNA-binding transcriptional activator of the SARP family [Lentzea xinjiangensis]